MGMIQHGDALDLLRTMPTSSVDSIVTDPPYGLDFMGKSWDKTLPNPEIWVQCRRVLKPGGHMVAFGAPRLYHRLGCQIEDAGFELRDLLMWLFGCLSDDTEILVDGEWVPFQMATAGRLAMCYDAEHDTYAWQPIEQLFVYDHNETAYRIKSGDTDQIVSRNHRCIVRRDGRWAFVLAEALSGQEVVPVLEGLRGLPGVVRVRDSLPVGEEQVLPSMSDCQTEAEARIKSEEATVNGGVCGVQEGVQAPTVAPEGDRPQLLAAVQRSCERGAASEAPAGVSGEAQVGADPARRAQGAHDGCEQPVMEGRRDDSRRQGELRGSGVREVPAGLFVDGSERRVRHGAPLGSRDGDGSLPDAHGVRPSRGPQPTEQRSVEPHAVCHEPGPQDVRGEGVTRSTLASVTPVHYAGQVWCVKVPTGAFVARRNGQIFVTGNSGFPKNHKIANGMDRHRNDEGEIREVCRFLRASMEARATSSAALGAHFGVHSRMVDHWAARDTDSQPTLPTWDQWIELVCFLVLDKLPGYDAMHALCWRLNGRKGTPGEAWGQREVVGHKSRNAITGATSILAGAGTEWDITLPASDDAQAWDGWGTALKPAWEPISLARKPFTGATTANVRKHGTGALNIDACMVGEDRDSTSFGGQRHPANLILDKLSALALAEATGNPVDRFFYAPKTSRAEREMGLEYRKRRHVNDGRKTSIDNPFQRGDSMRANVHPTVKPVALMRWLCRLITPPGGLVLDPFCGSGSTGIAAALEGFSFIGYELDAEYVEIAESRIWHAISNPSAYDPELNPADDDERQIRLPGT